MYRSVVKDIHKLHKDEASKMMITIIVTRLWEKNRESLPDVAQKVTKAVST